MLTRYLNNSERASLRQLRFQLFALGREVYNRALRGLCRGWGVEGGQNGVNISAAARLHERHESA